LLDGVGVKRAAVSGQGLFKNAATDALRQTFVDGGIAGEHNGEATYDMALESNGELTFAADT
jgi:predicted secreted protein